MLPPLQNSQIQSKVINCHRLLIFKTAKIIPASCFFHPKPFLTVAKSVSFPNISLHNRFRFQIRVLTCRHVARVPCRVPCRAKKISARTWNSWTFFPIIIMIIILLQSLSIVCRKRTFMYEICCESPDLDVQSEFELKVLLSILVQWRNCPFCSIFWKEGIVQRRQ